MKRLTKIAVVTALAAGGAVLLAPRAQGQTGSTVAERDQARNVFGTVVDKADAPLGGAVVYLKNTKTLGVKTYISDDRGQFRFNSLSPNIDYEIYAEFNGARSGTKTVSSFDSRANFEITLRVDVKK